MNIILDLLFVIVFKAGVVGVALATIISQFVSAFLVLVLLVKKTLLKIILAVSKLSHLILTISLPDSKITTYLQSPF